MGVVMEHEILTDDGMTDDEITIYYHWIFMFKNMAVTCADTFLYY